MRYVILIFGILLFQLSCNKKDSPQPAQQPSEDDLPKPLPPGEIPDIPDSAPNLPDFVSFARLESDQLELLGQVNENDRLNTRFLSVCEQYNEGRPIENYSKGVDRALNSISKERDISVSRPNGIVGCTRSIDLRDFGLTRSDWDLIVAKNPFRRTFESFTSRGVLVKQLTQERQSWMPGHVFLFTVFQANVYRRLLNLPDNLQDLQRQLGVNLQNNFDQEDRDTYLFGHTQSPIAIGKPRMHLRTESDDGFYYQSYDIVIANIGFREKNVFQSPFPVEARSINTLLPDGHEVIFSLPNQMLGFYLADGFGNVQDFAPLDLVVDNEASARALDPTIRYLSCSRCHSSGLIAREDELFEKVQSDNSFDNQDVQKSAFWHGRPDGLSAALRRDNSIFGDSLDQIGASITEPDQINIYGDRLRQEANLEQVAALMFMSPREFERELAATDVSLNQIGALLNGDTISFEQLQETLPIFVQEANIFRDDFGE